MAFLWSAHNLCFQGKMKKIPKLLQFPTGSKVFLKCSQHAVLSGIFLKWKTPLSFNVRDKFWYKENTGKSESLTKISGQFSPKSPNLLSWKAPRKEFYTCDQVIKVFCRILKLTNLFNEFHKKLLLMFYRLTAKGLPEYHIELLCYFHSAHYCRWKYSES